MPSTSTDAELVQASIDGNMAAFSTLVERHQNLVCSIAYSATGDRALSEDVGQEVFVAAWKRLAELEEPDKVKGWLCGTARNLSKMALRKRKREILDEEPGAAIVSHHSSAEDSLLAKEQESLVWEALKEVPENFREPLVLFYREEQSVRQVAEGLDLSEDAVKQRLSRGRQYLKVELLSTVGSTLASNRPTKAFAAGVVAAVLSQAGGAAAATATASGANAGTSAKTGGLLIGALVKAGAALLVVAALVGTFAAVMRSQQDSENDDSAGMQAKETLAEDSTGQSNRGRSAGTTIQGPNLAAPITRGSFLATLSDDDMPQEGFSQSAALQSCMFDDDELHDLIATLSVTTGTGPLDIEIVESAAKDGKAASQKGARTISAQEEEALRRCATGQISQLGLKAGKHRLVFAAWARRGGGSGPSLRKQVGLYQGVYNAPVKVTVFTDFACTQCSSMATILKELRDKYGDKILVELLPYPMDAKGEFAARALYAAYYQGLLWEMHDGLFDNPHIRQRDDLIHYAGSLGLDAAMFEEILDSETTTSVLEAIADTARELGIDAVPTTIIGDQHFAGAQPAAVFHQAVDAVLKKASSPTRTESTTTEVQQ